jgi:hypothetical protein
MWVLVGCYPTFSARSSATHLKRALTARARFVFVRQDIAPHERTQAGIQVTRRACGPMIVFVVGLPFRGADRAKHASFGRRA